VAFGRRDAEDAEAYGSQRIENTGIRVIDFAEVRRRGVSDAASGAIEYLSRPEVVGFWVHLDADVLDDAVVPAVDYRVPGPNFSGANGLVERRVRKSDRLRFE